MKSFIQTTVLTVIAVASFSGIVPGVAFAYDDNLGSFQTAPMDNNLGSFQTQPLDNNLGSFQTAPMDNNLGSFQTQPLDNNLGSFQTQPLDNNLGSFQTTPTQPGTAIIGSTPGTAIIGSVPTYSSYDVYAQTPYYASAPYYGYGSTGYGYASLGIGLGFGSSFYPTPTFFPSTNFVPTFIPTSAGSTYSPTTISNPTTTYSPTTISSPTSVYAPAPVSTYSPTDIYAPTSTYAPTNTSTYAPTDTSIYSPTNTSTYAPTSVYAPSDSHNSVYSPSTVTTDSHNYTGPVTVSVVSNTTSAAAPQYPAQYVYGGGSAYVGPSYYNTPTYFPSYAQAPTCTITASGSGYGISYGRAVVLSWTSTNANSGYISPLVGTVAPAGSTTVYPNQNTLYTLTVSGNGGTSSCQTYAGAGYAAPIASAAAPYVALTQIPYTGFAFGLFGNAIYWTLLALFAVAISYLVLYFRGGAFALVSGMVRGKTNAERTPNVAERTQKNPVAASVVETKSAKVESSRGDTSQSRGVTSGGGTKDSMLSVGETEGGIGPRIVVLRS